MRDAFPQVASVREVCENRKGSEVTVESVADVRCSDLEA